jgi:predicted GTPase
MVQVAFLDYIRRWKKKVVFVLNKADVLREQADLDAVTGFVRDNAQRLLQLDSPVVLPVSARKALRAKLAVSRFEYAPPVVDNNSAISHCSCRVGHLHTVCKALAAAACCSA